MLAGDSGSEAGVTHWRLMRGTPCQLCIQAHSSSLRCGGSLCKARSDDKVNPLRETPHPCLPQSGEGAFCRFPLNFGREFARYPPQLGEG